MVLIVILAFLVFISMFALAARFGTKFAGRILGDKINGLHRAAEHILDTGEVPPEWQDARPHKPGGGESAETPTPITRANVRRLSKLIRYMQRSPVFADIESREYVLAELERVRRTWQQKA